ncbi:DMT family transporter, partial [Bacillus sp. B-TM1]
LFNDDSKYAKKIHLSIAYAIWSGVGTLLITIISVYFFKEHISLFQAFCILFNDDSKYAKTNSIKYENQYTWNELC